MTISLADLRFAISLEDMSDEDFLLAWRTEVSANDEARFAVARERCNRSFRPVHLAPPLREALS